MRLMFPTIVLFILLLSVGCSSGIIPCPKIKSVKMHRTNPNKRFSFPTESLSASAAEEDKPVQKRKVNDLKVIQNVTMEEWDCPKPGKKKYMPRKVKENIRRNMEKVNSNQKDSVEVNTSNR